jgi:2',3'-cyclic-nucleotide 2'-phosphodiesterase (5'-nucleotidase family)
MQTVTTLNESDLMIKCPFETGNRMAHEMKNKMGCDLVIALTHMRIVCPRNI